MQRIRILPEIISNKIAAGEVVERPASVVKELVENALDAASKRVAVEVEKGGRSLIRVSDNGSGMNHDDALLAIERYATSKIYEDADLFAIRTLGFRGEALPSIASVSRFELISRAAGLDIGTRIVIAGGKIKKVSEVGAPPGTMVTVEQLFYNTPARRKFLKTINTEMGHIIETVAGMALGWHGVQFRLMHNGREIKNWPQVSEPMERAADVLGRGIRETLQPVNRDDTAIKLRGWVAAPGAARSTSRGIYLYVNGRTVRDRVIQHALFQGYGGRLMKGQFPMAVLFIDVPYDRVDVNVHPTKNEVRFADQRFIHDSIRDAVATALARVDKTKWGSIQGFGKDGEQISEHIARFGRPSVPEIGVSFQEPSAPAVPARATGIDGRGAADGSNREHFSQAAEKIPMSAQPSQQERLWPQKRFADLKIIGQFSETFLLCEAGQDLIVIDQHAAHERIMYEQLKRRAQKSRPATQGLLVPETIELGFREAQILQAMLSDLQRLGLEIEPFGGNTFIVKAVPVLLGQGSVEPLVNEIVEKMAEIGFAPGLEKAFHECLHLMACHGAIRANQSLNQVEIKRLLVQLDACEEPSNCPHGRPTWVKWDRRFFEKAFGRIK